VSNDPSKQIDKVLSNLSVATQDTDVIQGLEAVLGRENLLKIQNVLLKDAIKKSNVTEILSTGINLKTEPELSIKNEEVFPKKEITQKKLATARKKSMPLKKDISSSGASETRKRRNELERLLKDVNEVFDSTELIQSSLRPRACTLVKTSEDLNQKYNLKNAFVLIERLDLSGIDKSITCKGETCNVGEQVQIDPEEVQIDPEEEIKNIVVASNIVEHPIVKSNPVQTKSGKRRNQYLWSKGIIKKKPKINKNTDDEWEDMFEETIEMDSDIIQSIGMKDFIDMLEKLDESDLVDNKTEVFRIKVSHKNKSKEVKMNSLPNEANAELLTNTLTDDDPKEMENSTQNKVYEETSQNDELSVEENLKHEETIEQLEDCEVIDLLDDDEDKLRPWLNFSKSNQSKKEMKACDLMLTKYSLAALFKCMGKSCCFYTNDKNFFKVHIELHEQQRKKDQYLLCSYCNHDASTASTLIGHIEAAHSYERFR
jgi:hypothetical protein